MEALAVLLKPFIISIVGEVLAYFFHRRNTDPDFLAKSDEIFSRLVAAQSSQEKQDASKAIQDLINS